MSMGVIGGARRRTAAVNFELLYKVVLSQGVRACSCWCWAFSATCYVHIINNVGNSSTKEFVANAGQNTRWRGVRLLLLVSGHRPTAQEWACAADRDYVSIHRGLAHVSAHTRNWVFLGFFLGRTGR